MSREPVKRIESVISKRMLGRIGLTALYMTVVFLLQYATNFLSVAEELMPTALFGMFALFQLFNSFNCRVLTNESIFKTITQNRLMLAAVSATFVLQVLIIQFAGAFFNVVPLSFDVWAKLFGVAASIIALSELIKLVSRALESRNS
jgi:Ca2+-transporting ATPase